MLIERQEIMDYYNEAPQRSQIRTIDQYRKKMEKILMELEVYCRKGDFIP
jgi:hypothetical protein